MFRKMIIATIAMMIMAIPAFAQDEEPEAFTVAGTASTTFQVLADQLQFGPFTLQYGAYFSGGIDETGSYMVGSNGVVLHANVYAPGQVRPAHSNELSIYQATFEEMPDAEYTCVKTTSNHFGRLGTEDGSPAATVAGNVNVLVASTSDGRNWMEIAGIWLVYEYQENGQLLTPIPMADCGTYGNYDPAFYQPTSGGGSLSSYACGSYIVVPLNGTNVPAGRTVRTNEYEIFDAGESLPNLSNQYALSYEDNGSCATYLRQTLQG